MEFILLFNEREGSPPPVKEGLAAMAAYSGQLRTQGVLRRGGPLAPASAAATVRVRQDKALVTDGPFAETKELVAGLWIVEVAGRAEAVEIARHCPHARRGPIELHVLQGRRTLPDAENGAPFLLAFRSAPGLADPDGAKRREMLAFATALEREGILFERAAIGDDPPAARIEARAGALSVADGPFDALDAIGAYSLVRAADRAAAIALATRCPHARWAPVEVREIPFFDPV